MAKHLRVARCHHCKKEVSEMRHPLNRGLWYHRSSGSKYCDDTGQTQVDAKKLEKVER